MAQPSLAIPAQGMGALAGRLAAALAAERDQWLLWTPAAFGFGVAVYFGLPIEPPLWLGPLLAAGSTGAAMALRRRAALLPVVIAFALAALGFTAATMRTALIAAPLLGREIGPVQVEGRLVAIEPLPSGQRLVIADPVVEDLAPDATPARLRVKLAREDPALAVGDRIAVLAKLSPPAAPFAPGAFDFQRDAFFDRIGAVGFALGAARVLAKNERGPDAFGETVSALRQAIATRILAALPGRTGPIAVALVTGSQSAIDKPTMAAMRDSGLAHLLSISGLHVGFVAAILFFALRAGLALWPAVALRYPIKKWAALAALACTFLYMLLAGSPVPTQRAFLMTGLVLLAVLVDRVALSMRLVAWAAFVVLLLRPETLIGPSFQMSFAAVMALIAAYDGSREWRLRLRAEAGPLRRFALYVGGLVATSLVAGLATAPYAIYHFNRFTEYGVLANMLAVPLTGFWIMPWAVAASLLMPFGLERIALIPMGWGIEGVIRIAETAASWPGAVLLLPAMPLAGLALATLGGLWLCLWRSRWRWWGMAAILAGMASIAFARTPDILVSDDGKLIAVKGEDGRLLLNARRTGLAAETWLRRAGQSERDDWPEEGSSADGRLACDPLGCLYRAQGHIVALAWSNEALPEDCQVADLVLALEPVRMDCPSAARVIDRFDLWREGGFAVWLAPNRIEVESVAEGRGQRPWVARPTAAD